jgi:TRAP-type C4-dicarboxylate transport system permease small subunit
VRTFLERLYAGALAMAALAIVSIAVLVLIQVAGRIVDRIALSTGSQSFGIAVPSLAEIGGFLFVGSAFLALAGTFRSAGHVRVTMLVRLAGPKARQAMTLLALAMAVALAGFAAWNAGVQALDSWRFDSVSYGMVRIPLWIPQGFMTLGLGVFLVALVDELVVALTGRIPAFRQAEATREEQGSL